MSRDGERLFRLAAERAAARRHHLAWVLSQYSASQGITPAELATELACSEAVMLRLALCLRPRPERFADDVTIIAATVVVDGIALARIVRHVEALEAMTAGGKPGRGMLMAARKRRIAEANKDDEPSH